MFFSQDNLRWKEVAGRAIHCHPAYVIGGVILKIINHLHGDIKGVKIKGTQYVLAQYAKDTEFIQDGSIQYLRTILSKLEYFYHIGD